MQLIRARIWIESIERAAHVNISEMHVYRNSFQPSLSPPENLQAISKSSWSMWKTESITIAQTRRQRVLLAAQNLHSCPPLQSVVSSVPLRKEGKRGEGESCSAKPYSHIV